MKKLLEEKTRKQALDTKKMELPCQMMTLLSGCFKNEEKYFL